MVHASIVWRWKAKSSARHVVHSCNSVLQGPRWENQEFKASLSQKKKADLMLFRFILLAVFCRKTVPRVFMQVIYGSSFTILPSWNSLLSPTFLRRSWAHRPSHHLCGRWRQAMPFPSSCLLLSGSWWGRGTVTLVSFYSPRLAVHLLLESAASSALHPGCGFSMWRKWLQNDVFSCKNASTFL